jgi:hypothetical protein
MLADRSFRSLENLERTSSTARVLNLLKVSREHEGDWDWKEKPLFLTPELNRCLLIKHRLRSNEYDRFLDGRQVALKVVIPIDRRDLKTGGRYIFVGQVNYEKAILEAFGIGIDHPDCMILDVMDRTPSLDPFLLREQLSRVGVEPADCYFSLSESDFKSMLEFVRSEITPLVKMSMITSAAGVRSIERMASKILSNVPGEDTNILGTTLRMSPAEYHNGVFCWKGFLYYKWSLGVLMKDVVAVSAKLDSIRPRGPVDTISNNYINRSRKTVQDRIVRTCKEVKSTLQIYDTAYADLTEEGKPMAFREFLLKAPSMFTRLGEQVGSLQHIVSFTNYRFGARGGNIGSEELMDILIDFELSLRGRAEVD